MMELKRFCLFFKLGIYFYTLTVKLDQLYGTKRNVNFEIAESIKLGP